MKFYSVLDKCKNVISDVIILKYVKRRLHLFERVQFIFIIEFSMLKLHLKVFNCSQVSDYMPAVSNTPSLVSGSCGASIMLCIIGQPACMSLVTSQMI